MEHLGIQCLCSISHGSGCAWSLLLIEQPTFAFMNYMCAGVVGLVLMMELASLMFVFKF